MKLQVSADSRDEKLGIVKKKVHIGDFSFTTPAKSTKYNNNELYQGEKKRVNEITRSLKIDHLSNFHDEENYSARFVKDVRKQFLDESLNIPIFNINSTQLPNPEHTKTLGHVIYAASDKIVCLPTVKKSAYCVMELTSGGKPVQKIRDNSFDKYINFQKTIIDELKLSNSKEILGMIPFLSPKFSIKLFYQQ